MRHLLNEAASLQPRLTAIRRDIHRHPELGRCETRTQQIVLTTLRELGLAPRTIADTGVLADITGDQDGPIVALRADMDALPLTEKTGLPFASESAGCMHACGHDMHTAMLIGAAELLCDNRDKLRGTVRLLFQPDEEGDGGAQRMIDEGAMNGVKAVFGCHVAPELPCGQVAVCPGKAYAASNPFDIAVTGAGAHGAEPHKGRDALLAASAIVMELQALISRELDPLEPAVITIGRLEAGTARNILAGEARLQGILRCFGEDMRALLTRRIGEIAASVAKAHRCRAETNITWGYAGVINDIDATALTERMGRQLVGERNVSRYMPTLTTEDFGALLNRAPGSFWHLGVGRAERDNAPLHSPRFDPDEDALSIGVAMHAAVAMNALEEWGK